MIGGAMFGGHRRPSGSGEVPVELRFVDLLLIVVATVMFMAVLLTVVSAFTSGGRPDVAPRITTASAPTALVHQPYRLTLAAVGGDGTLVWRLAAGRLPGGLVLGADGLISGSASRAGESTVTVEVRDGQHRSHRQHLVLRARTAGPGQRQPSTPRVASPTTLLPEATSGRAYRYSFGAESAQEPVRWRIADGSPPAGLSLAGEGTLVGSPDRDGITDFAVEVTDGTGTTATQRVRLVVHPAPKGWWGTALTWIWRGITYLGYLLLLLMLSTLVFGAAPSEGHGGLIGWLRNR